MREERITHPDGTAINLRSWPTSGPARAAIVLQHGFNAHTGHLDWAAQQLAAAGYAGYGVDLRGRGKSDGERFYVDSFDQYLADTQLAFDKARADHPGLPVFLIGHSAGGVIASTYALRHPGEIAGLICHSFAFRVPAPSFVLDLVTLISGALPRLKVLKLRNEDFSRDPAWVAMMNADPLIHDERQPAKTVGQMWKADRVLEASFPQITLPVLIIHGTEDHATLPKGSQFFFDTTGATDKTLKLYEGHYHDLLADTGKDGVMADIVTWLDARV